MIALPPLYHVGIIVPDITKAQSRLTEMLGVSWGPVIRMDSVPYRDASRTRRRAPHGNVLLDR